MEKTENNSAQLHDRNLHIGDSTQPCSNVQQRLRREIDDLSYRISCLENHSQHEQDPPSDETRDNLTYLRELLASRQAVFEWLQQKSTVPQ